MSNEDFSYKEMENRSFNVGDIVEYDKTLSSYDPLFGEGTFVVTEISKAVPTFYWLTNTKFPFWYDFVHETSIRRVKKEKNENV
jgi:hypothetical protein